MCIGVLRDLTRYRTKLVQYQSAVANRIQRLLEQCDIKLASVASDALGVSAMAMLRAFGGGRDGCGANGRHGQKATAEEDSSAATGA